MVLVLVASVTSAQDRVEVGAFVGYTFSEGVNIDPVALGGQIFDHVGPSSALSYGFSVDVFVTENAQVGFQLGQQASKLKGGGPGAGEEFVDMNVNNYHGTFTYNWGDSDAMARPFLFGGIGATQYSPQELMGNLIDSSTRFSSTWGGGVKVYPGRNVGLKLTARWTPTYIKSDPAGVWCSPYWGFGCYQLVDTDYSNQFEMSAGVSVRF
jgi:opacity protein-like surface antigen